MSGATAPIPLADGLLEGTCIVDPQELRLVEVDARAAALIGAEPASLRGRAVTDFFAMPEDVAFWAEVQAGTDAVLHSYTGLSRPDGGSTHVDRKVCRIAQGPRTGLWRIALVDCSRQKAMEDELEKLVAELRATLESTADGILVCAPDGGIRAFNRRFAQMWDVPKDLLMRRDDAAVQALLEAQVTDTDNYRLRMRDIASATDSEAVDVLTLRSGRIVRRLALPQFSRGRVIGRVFSYQDVTERVEAENGLRLAATVFDASPDAVFVADANHRIVSVNPACRRLARQEGDALAGTSAIDLFEDPDAGRLFTEVQKSWRSAGVWEGEVWHRRGDGSNCPVRLSWVVLRGVAGEVQQSIGFFRDLSAQRAAQRRIEELAYSDTLTGLPNRLLLARRMERLLSQQRGNEARQPFAILFVDLDRFKNINDSLGHQFGDRVLINVADRLKSCLRLADTLCRVGGDEFVVHLHNADAVSAEQVAQRIQQSLAQPFALDDLRFSVGGSIGIALHPRDGHSLDDLVRHADTAMFRVKERGRGSYRFYQPEMNVDLLSRMRLEQAMREAMEERRFVLQYQPQIELSTGRLVGAEALIRWNDEALGPVSPGEFIPLAEESGFIVVIGAWVLEEAVRQAAVWQQAGTPVRVSVNVSALQFRQADFIERVAAGIRISGLAPELLELELTESILIQDADEVLERLHALAAIGVQLAIDDFGTGYSSLAYLKKFPIHRLKIDQSFVRGLPDDESDLAIVTAMTSMGRALRLEMVAEGVETAAQHECLRQLQCDHFQGYLCAPGLPADELTRRLGRMPPFMPG